VKISLLQQQIFTNVNLGVALCKISVSKSFRDPLGFNLGY